MGTTPTLALRYPDGTAVPYVHLDIKKLAEDTEGAIVAVTDGDWQDLTLATNFAVSNTLTRPRVKLRADGYVELCNARIKRTSDLAMTAGATYTVATLPSGYEPATNGDISFGGAIRQPSGVPIVVEWIVTSGGSLQIRPGTSMTWTAASPTDQGINGAIWLPA